MSFVTRKLKIIVFIVFIVFCLISAASVAGVGEGQELYDSYCQLCHGGIGEGQTMGKPLTDRGAKGLSDDELIAVITDGRSGTGMSAWGNSFNAIEILDIAGYVRVLQGEVGLASTDNNATVSDDPEAQAGEQLFNNSAGCISCHSYQDRGGQVGPALDGIGSRLSQDDLLQAMLNPSQSIVNGYEAKIVEQADGTIVTGRFRNDSELAVQIQSTDGSRWVTYFKDRVNSITDSADSLMPDIFANLGAAEQVRLLAFLKTL